MTRELNIRPKATDDDYKVKFDHIIRFLRDGAQVKLTVMFRGREVTHPKLGEELLHRFAKDLEQYAKAELPAVFAGSKMSLMFTPKTIG